MEKRDSSPRSHSQGIRCQVMLWRITETPEAPQLHTTTALLSAPPP